MGRLTVAKLVALRDAAREQATEDAKYPKRRAFQAADVIPALDELIERSRHEHDAAHACGLAGIAHDSGWSFELSSSDNEIRIVAKAPPKGK